MRSCMLTKKTLREDQLVETLEGPVAVFLWGRREVKMRDGLAVLPKDLADKYKTVFGKEAPEDLVE